MTPAARLQAAIEILDEVIASARDDGPPADTIVTRYFKQRRYAGSKDRRAVRELVFRAIRRSAERPASGRAAILGLADDEPELAQLFGEPRGPEPRRAGEAAALAAAGSGMAARGAVAAGRPEEWPALLERAPLDLRVNVARASREELLSAIRRTRRRRRSVRGAFACRRTAGSTIIRPIAAGLVEVQDEGSQLIALACEPATASDPRPLRRRRRQVAGARRRGARAHGSSRPTAIAPACRSCRRAPSAPARGSRRACSIRRNELAELADWRAPPTSCWSTRLARAAGPGGAIPKGAGG